MVDLIFFSSPIGLGHATRDVAISCNLEDTSKRFVSGGAASALISQGGFDVDNLYNPPAFKLKMENCSNHSSGSSSTILTTQSVKQSRLRYSRYIIQELL